MAKRTKPSEVLDEIIDDRMKQLEKKKELIDLEHFYINGQLENLEQLVELKKKDLTNKLVEFKEKTSGQEYNPYLVSSYFFKSLNSMSFVEPEYSPEKLGIVWDLYMYLIEEVNLQIGQIHPTISHFCRFAGISTNKLKTYRNNGSLEMQTLVNKIFDITFDSNILLAQTKHLSNRSTELRVKVENEVQEKPHVNVNVNVNEEVDLNQIASRLKEIDRFKSTKKVIEGDSIE